MNAWFYCYECNKKVLLEPTDAVDKHRIGKHLFCLECKSEKGTESDSTSDDLTGTPVNTSRARCDGDT